MRRVLTVRSWEMNRRRVAAIVTTAIVCLGLVPAATAGAVPNARPAASGQEAPRVLPLDQDTVNPADLLGLPAAPPARPAVPSPFAVAPFAAAAHTIDVAVVAPAGSGGTDFITDQAVRDLVARTGAYWKAQSNNQVMSLTPNATIHRLASTNSCSQRDAIWGEAAALFGHSNLGYYVSTGARHLLVLVPNGCGQFGAGTLGSYSAPVSGTNGGAVWASLNGVNDLDVLAHEFGHNLGMMHSNTVICPDASMTEGVLDTSTNTYSDGCRDDPYTDLYDVMGAAFTFNGAANPAPTALNINHKVRMDAVAAGEIQSVFLAADQTQQDIVSTLASTGAASGRRALSVTDPRTGRVYYVDYRGGGGMDAGALYTKGLPASSGVSTGVRVLTTRDDGSSVVLMSPDSAAANGHRLYLSAGQSLSTRSRGVTVSVQGISAGTASVKVSLSLPTTADRNHDFDGDGLVDVLARDSAGTLWLYPGDGTGGWLARTQVGSGWNGMTSIVGPGDFNGDGSVDVLARDSAGTLWLYPGNGTGGWLARTQAGSGWNGMTAII